MQKVATFSCSQNFPLFTVGDKFGVYLSCWISIVTEKSQIFNVVFLVNEIYQFIILQLQKKSASA